MMTGIQSELLRWTRLAAVDHAQMLEGAQQLLATLAKLPEIHSRDPAACRPLVEQLLSDRSEGRLVVGG